MSIIANIGVIATAPFFQKIQTSEMPFLYVPPKIPSPFLTATNPQMNALYTGGKHPPITVVVSVCLESLYSISPYSPNLLLLLYCISQYNHLELFIRHTYYATK